MNSIKAVFNAIKKPFPFFLSCSFLLYLLFPVYFPLYPYVTESNRSLDVRSFTPSLFSGFIYILSFSFLYYAYLKLYSLVKKDLISLSLKKLLLLTTLVAVPLLFTYPINANDLFRYFLFARLANVYEANPFVITLTQFPQESFLHLAGEWANYATPYGPVWEWITKQLISPTVDHIYASIILLKLFALVTHLANSTLIWHLNSKNNQQSMTLLWALNPALLFIFIIDGHNDFLMLFWLLLALLLQKKEWHLAAVFIGWLSPLTKLIGLLPFPFLFLVSWKAQTTTAAKFRFTLIATLSIILLTTITFLPYGSPLPLISRLATEASAQNLGFSIPTLLILLTQKTTLITLVLKLLKLLPLLFTFYALYLVWNGFRKPITPSFFSRIFLAYLLQASAFRVWYASWLFPFSLLDSSPETDWWRTSSLAFLYTTQLSIFIYNHLWFYLFNGNHLWSHLLGVSLTFIFPFVLATHVNRNTPHLYTPQIEK